MSDFQGNAEVVLEKAKTHQMLLEDQERVRRLRGISRGLEQAKSGAGRPMREFLKEVAKQHGIALK